MNARSIPCRLYEPDGTLLADGTSRAEEVPVPGQTIWIAIADGERMIHRYLLESVREVYLEIGNGPAVVARVERVTISPRLGGICTLRIGDGRPQSAGTSRRGAYRPEAAPAGRSDAALQSPGR